MLRRGPPFAWAIESGLYGNLACQRVTVWLSGITQAVCNSGNVMTVARANEIKLYNQHVGVEKPPPPAIRVPLSISMKSTSPAFARIV